MRRAGFLQLAAVAAIPTVAPAATLPSFDALERRYGGRLGVFAIDLGNGRRIAYRAGEAFPMCSTFKVLAVGAVLQRVHDGHEQLTRRVAFSSRDILSYAPVAKAHMAHDGTGAMTVADLCAAAIEWSDNTAASLLLRSVGGPVGLTAFLRGLGDRRTRLDRGEPELNEALPGDPRDTTRPAAIAADLRTLAFGEMLGPYAVRLRGWMLACRTSANRIPAGLPHGWRSGNKTGSGDYATANDVAFLLPPAGAPKVVAAYFTGSHANPHQQEAVLAEVGRIVAARLGQPAPP